MRAIWKKQISFWRNILFISGASLRRGNKIATIGLTCKYSSQTKAPVRVMELRASGIRIGDDDFFISNLQMSDQIQVLKHEKLYFVEFAHTRINFEANSCREIVYLLQIYNN